MGREGARLQRVLYNHPSLYGWDSRANIWEVRGAITKKGVARAERGVRRIKRAIWC
jgi:hypothetical protein